MAKRSQQDSGEERVTAESRVMMNLIARTPSFVSSSTSVSTDLFEASDHYFHEQFMESFSPTNYSKLDDDRAWFSQEWEAKATTYDRSWRPDKTSWRVVRKVRPDHEEILLDGTAQTVRFGEMIHDGSGRVKTSKISSLETMKQNWKCL